MMHKRQDRKSVAIKDFICRLKRTAICILFIFVFTHNCFAIKISTVLGTGGGIFDPWNTTRWAAWYSGSKIVEIFEIDCNVVFATRSTAWSPDVSECKSGILFLLADSGRGVTVDGDGITIDVRTSTPTLTQLYQNPSSYDSYGTDYGFKCWQSYSASLPPTVIKDFWIKGFSQAIRTNDVQAHPLIIQNVGFRRNKWGVYMAGANTTITGSSICEQARGAVYIDASAHNNSILNTTFRDNDYAQDYFWGDIAVDSTYNNLLEGNNHIPSNVSGSYWHCAIRFYRNMGEDGILRENSSSHNIVRYNSVNGYSVAYDVGSRMGIDRAYDLSREGRDHASYNSFIGNDINDTTIGIKINCSSNTIQSNTFTDVTKPIVLHCVFYNLFNIIINDQAGDNVYFWFMASDYSSYSDWFSLQDDLNGSISECSKLIHIRSDYGAPNFQPYSGCAQVIKAPTLFTDSAGRWSDITGDRFVNFMDIAALALQWQQTDCDAQNSYCGGADTDFSGDVEYGDVQLCAESWLDELSMKDTYSTGGMPIDIAVGDFWINSPGDEVAVIWDTAVSNINDANYYSIIIYDCNGVEIDRSGRSTVRWEAITAGNFLDDNNYPGDEIAAVHSSAIGGYYPVYVFGRGRLTPSVTLLTTNNRKIGDLAAGSFDGSADDYDEIAAIYSGGSETIKFCKASIPSWTAITTGAASLTRIAAGNFNATASDGDEIAGVNASSSLIYYYKVAGTTNYSTAAVTGLATWTAIAGGNFDRITTREEVVVASSLAVSGVYPLSYYVSGATGAFRTENQDVLTKPVCSLAAGNAIASGIGLYERIKGFSSTDYAATMASWGKQTIVLPSEAEAVSIPAFWLSTNPSYSSRQYLRVTPILR